jgi:hypothetical protein
MRARTQEKSSTKRTLPPIEDEALENEGKEPALEDGSHQEMSEGDASANSPFRRVALENERSPSLDSLEDVTPPIKILYRRELKERISFLEKQVEGFKSHAQTQQVVMERWKAKFSALFSYLKCFVWKLYN